MANISSFPNNQSTYVGAEYVMRWLHGRTSGVFGAEDNAKVTVLANSMNLEVGAGIGWLSNSKNNGIVWWNDIPLTLTVPTADSNYPRIDRVIVEWTTTNYVALPEIKILKGSTDGANNPIAPALTNNDTLRQISLAKILVPKGATSLLASNLTDERLDTSVCGLVTETISVDTSMMQNQFEALLIAIQEELADIEAGAGVEMAKKQFNNTIVPTSAFVSDSTYEDFPYRASVPLTGVISSMIPEVVMGVTDAMSGLFAPISETYNGGIYLYSADIPEENVVIPTILCWRGTV